MECPECGVKTKVIGSRVGCNNVVTRRRKCDICKSRFSTEELIIDGTEKTEDEQNKPFKHYYY